LETYTNMAAMTSHVNKLNDSNDKDMAAMLVYVTREANEKSFVNVHQHGGSDVTCKQTE
jgi:hypothetical protein